MSGRVGGEPLSPVGNNSPQNSVLVVILTLLLIPCLIAYMMVMGNESQVAALVLAVIGGLVIIARPFWGLIFFVALLYTRPEESIPALQGMRLPLIVSSVTLLTVFFHKLLNREPLVKTPINGMILGFGAAAVASAVMLGTASEAAQDIARLVILVFLVLNLVTTAKLYNTFSTALVCFTGYLAAYSIYLYSTGAALMEHGALRSQATGIFADPNDLAGTIVAGLGVALFRTRAEKKSYRIFYFLLSAVFVSAIFLTHSRGGMIALLAVLGYFIFASIQRKGTALLVMVLALVPLFILGGGRATNFDSSDASANSRFWFWTTGVEQLAQHPFLGVGYGGFPDVNGGMTAHNSFVLCFAETGLIGYFFWIGCFYYSFRRFSPVELESVEYVVEYVEETEDAARKMVLRQRETEALESKKKRDAVELLGARLGLAGFLVSAFWISRSYVPVLYLFISLPLAQQISARPYLQNIVLGSQERSRDWGRIALICLVSIIVIYVFALRNR